MDCIVKNGPEFGPFQWCSEYKKCFNNNPDEDTGGEKRPFLGSKVVILGQKVALWASICKIVCK